jgi:hypothetical protein
LTKRSPARLAKLLSDLVLIQKAKVRELAATLADAEAGHVRAVDALSAPQPIVPPALAALSQQAMEQRVLRISAALLLAEQKLLNDGCQMKLFEGRAVAAAGQQAAAADRNSLAEVIERCVKSRDRAR